MLPPPCLSFTLPSIHDDTKLDCRVYHPPCLLNSSHYDSPWRGHAAAVAHPYAPLGGCFDDPIVDIAAGTLLQLGFLVATFNFRSVQPVPHPHISTNIRISRGAEAPDHQLVVLHGRLNLSRPTTSPSLAFWPTMFTT